MLLINYALTLVYSIRKDILRLIFILRYRINIIEIGGIDSYSVKIIIIEILIIEGKYNECK